MFRWLDDNHFCLNRAVFNRYGFDSTTGTCIEFVYGGCLGNTNNFQTLEECQQTCPDVDVCELEAGVVGPCAAVIPRYTFENGECTEFNYGGCGGNNNNFNTLAECQSTCISDDICELPSEQGPCR